MNEYPSMAGIVDARERRIFCGATISECQYQKINSASGLATVNHGFVLVSSTHALTAAHCMLGRIISSLGLLVGEHDITKGSETPLTSLLRISTVLSHPNFNRNTIANDIALIMTQNVMTFSRGVRAACLPFKYGSERFENKHVQAMGW